MFLHVFANIAHIIGRWVVEDKRARAWPARFTVWHVTPLLSYSWKT